MYSCFRKLKISFAFFPGNGISSAVASLNWVFNMALKTGECKLNIWRWTWNLLSSTKRTRSLSSQGSEKGFISSHSSSISSKSSWHSETSKKRKACSLRSYWHFWLTLHTLYWHSVALSCFISILVPIVLFASLSLRVLGTRNERL